MTRLLLFVALTVVVAGGCRKTSADAGPYSGGGNPTPEGAAQAVRQNVKRAVTGIEMHDLHLMMNTMKLSSGRVPTSQEVMDALGRPDGNRQLLKFIQDGEIVVVPNPPEEGLWAYAKDVPTKGGWVITHTGEFQATPAQYAELSRMN
jgi:hypothetical protein